MTPIAPSLPDPPVQYVAEIPCQTTPSIGKKPPGRTEPPLRLDKLTALGCQRSSCMPSYATKHIVPQYVPMAQLCVISSPGRGGVALHGGDKRGPITYRGRAGASGTTIPSALSSSTAPLPPVATSPRGAISSSRPVRGSSSFSRGYPPTRHKPLARQRLSPGCTRVSTRPWPG
jgi:hypothetical protein